MDIRPWAERFWHLLQGATEILFRQEDERYRVWRQHFLWQRLALTLKMAIAAYFTFIVLRLSLQGFRPDPEEQTWLTMACIILLLLSGFLGYHLAPAGRRYPVVAFFGASWSITLVEQVWATLRGVAFPGVFAWTLVFLAQATLMPVRWPLHLLAQLGVFAYYWGVNNWMGLQQETTSDWDASLWLYLFWFCGICNLAVFLYERLQRAEFLAMRELEAEREKSERLLLNILPAAVAKQLKQDHRNQHTIAEQFPEVSVLFADIVGFTELSQGIPPTEIVSLLNHIFSEFDRLADVHGLEKIKTIGDSYMVVGGLPQERPDHLEAIANMALDMQESIAQFSMTSDRPLQIRIGINSGPVVAGVIGFKKFIYDLWGDTVNTASRMESHGVAGEIQVTETVYQRLKKRYELVERGEVEVKGKGTMRVYLLSRKLPGRHSLIFRLSKS